MTVLNRVLKMATSLARGLTHSASRPGGSSDERAPSRRPRRTSHTQAASGDPSRGVVEFDGQLPALQYRPQPDDEADPGEVVWAWVPYDENDGRGKDRPVLILARVDGGFLGLQMTSKDHDRDAAQEARWGRYWIDVGSGGWDSQGRDSEVRLDRPLYLPRGAVRREGAGLDQERYDDVAQALRALHNR
ncbi:MAG: type II toxin-antitoxin system PemK/MazF family toxin [Beutenbergiaceae bacterium]